MKTSRTIHQSVSSFFMVFNLLLQIGTVMRAHRRFAVGIVAAALSLLPHSSALSAVAADSKNREGLSVEITLSAGTKKTLTAPIAMRGSFQAKDFTFDFLRLDRVVSVVRDEKSASRSGFLLTLAGKEKPISITLDEAAQISGSGEWGRETIMFTTLTSAIVSPASAAPVEERKTDWICTLTTGDDLSIDWSNMYGNDPRFEGEIGNASLRLRAKQLTQLVRDDANTWTVQGGEQFRLQGWKPTGDSLGANCAYGFIKVPWGNISKLSSPDVASPSEKLQDPGLAAQDWRIEISRRFLLPITRLETRAKSTINDELLVKTINWASVNTAVATSAGLQLQFANKKAWILQGRLTAISPVGELDVSCKDITDLKRTAPTPSISPSRLTRRGSTTSMYDGEVVATVTTSSGAEYPVSTSSLAGGTEVGDSLGTGHRLVRVPTPPVEMWVSFESLLSGRLSTVDGRLVSSLPKLQRYGPFGGFTAIEFTNSAGEFTLPLARMAQYSPESSRSIAGVSATRAPMYRIVVRDEAGHEFADAVADMEFARYPWKAYSGTYPAASYPFRWHRNDSLCVKRDSGERIDVKFDKLKMIHIPDRYDDSTRPVVLTNVQGAQMQGSIYPGDVVTSYPGVSDWDPSKEGVLCRTADGTYVYVPFLKGTTIEILPAVRQ